MSGRTIGRTPIPAPHSSLRFYGLRTFPTIALLQILNHTIHHRGQLSTYLRPMGATVPSLHGPSYDAGGFTGGTIARASS